MYEISNNFSSFYLCFPLISPLFQVARSPYTLSKAGAQMVREVRHGRTVGFPPLTLGLFLY